MSTSPWLGAQAFSMKNKGRRALAPLPDGTRPYALKAKFEFQSTPWPLHPTSSSQEMTLKPLANCKAEKEDLTLDYLWEAQGPENRRICPLTKPIKSRPRIKHKLPKGLPQAWRSFSYVCCFALIPLMLKSRPVEEQIRSGSNPIQGSFLGKVWETFTFSHRTLQTPGNSLWPCG